MHNGSGVSFRLAASWRRSVKDVTPVIRSKRVRAEWVYPSRRSVPDQIAGHALRECPGMDALHEESFCWSFPSGPPLGVPFPFHSGEESSQTESAYLSKRSLASSRELHSLRSIGKHPGRDRGLSTAFLRRAGLPSHPKHMFASPGLSWGCSDSRTAPDVDSEPWK